MIMLDLTQPTARVERLVCRIAKGLVQNAKGLVVRNAKWFAIRRDKGLVMPMVVSTNESN